jgi:large subunit ribosomal protein L17
MRHNKKLNHLSRKTAHRKSMLSNMATSLIMHKRIFTTTAKAKALRREIEPIITLSKEDTTASRRLAFKFLQDKRAVTELFQVVAQKVADRPGGYTRIIKTGYRLGDNAQMCFIELVDFNESMLKTKVDRKARTRRSSKKKSEEKAGATEVKTEKIESKVAEPKAKAAESDVVESKAKAAEAVESKTAEPEAETVEAAESKTTEPEAEEAAESTETTESKVVEPKAKAVKATESDAVEPKAEAVESPADPKAKTAESPAEPIEGKAEEQAAKEDESKQE